ncbi:MAG: elongation factor G [Alphaproteobacteria bacterium]|nr:elongation factor G [Alphaproteobacteria bacterium]
MTLRNIGISAHIDSGKTTLAERILFLTGRVRAIHEVRGRDGVGARMDHDPIETRRGISIESAAVTVAWDGAQINVIDTPGHVDFTIEVERALAVLDGAILLLSATGGVQAQTRTVDRQMDRHGVPRIAFVNKCDLPGADPVHVVAQMREALGHNAALVQLPIGLGAGHRGVVDLWTRQGWAFTGPGGRDRVHIDIDWTDTHEAAREALLDAVSLADGALTELLLDGRTPSHAEWNAALRRTVLARAFVPVLVGSAARNIGVQPLLDAVVAWLPAPADRRVTARDAEGADVVLDPADPATVAYTFKVQETEHGAVSWVRVFQGGLERGQTLRNTRSRRDVRIGRLVRLDAGELQTVESVGNGEIVAVFGADLAFGDTLCAGEPLSFEGLEIPEPVVEVAVELVSGDRDRLGRALQRFTRQDPTVRVRMDEATGELRLRGMGELQLEILAERLQSESGLRVALGAPAVAYRRTLTRRARFDTKLKKQTGGPGQYARITGFIEPRGELAPFAWEVVGGAVPSEYASAVEKGFLAALDAGETELVGVRMVVDGGDHHPNDSSDRAFARVARMALLEALDAAGPVVLEPIMAVDVEADADSQGAAIRTLLSRRGVVTDAASDGRTVRIAAEVPLAELFGWTAALRSATGGSGTASVTFREYRPV